MECPYGEKCAYAHGTHELRLSDEAVGLLRHEAAIRMALEVKERDDHTSSRYSFSTQQQLPAAAAAAAAAGSVRPSAWQYPWPPLPPGVPAEQSYAPQAPRIQLGSPTLEFSGRGGGGASHAPSAVPPPPPPPPSTVIPGVDLGADEELVQSNPFLLMLARRAFSTVLQQTGSAAHASESVRQLVASTAREAAGHLASGLGQRRGYRRALVDGGIVMQTQMRGETVAVGLPGSSVDSDAVADAQAIDSLIAETVRVASGEERPYAESGAHTGHGPAGASEAVWHASEPTVDGEIAHVSPMAMGYAGVSRGKQTDGACGDSADEGDKVDSANVRCPAADGSDGSGAAVAHGTLPVEAASMWAPDPTASFSPHEGAYTALGPHTG